jgi:polysaccharide export outer membrane protein
MTKKIFFFVVATFLLTSCKTKEKGGQINYMQNLEQIATEAAVNANTTTIQSGDQLLITVSAKDMDVVKPFNQNYSSSETSQYSQSNGNIPIQGQVSDSGPTYLVGADGNIEFPILGILNTDGKSLAEFKEELRSRLTKFVINPTVTVKVINYKITILGQVSKPGQYIIPDGQATVLNAIGLAGDLTVYGKREDVLLVRNENGKITKERINLLDANFINSPFYYLKQGDVIFVSANKTQEKTSRLDPNLPIYISVASIAVTILALVFKN